MSTAALPLKPSDAAKRRRRPAGTPDPDAEVVSLPPQTLLESDRYTCEICKQGFQREQNLQMHRRRHKVPWKLLKKETAAAAGAGEPAKTKRVYVCPEPSCLHHEPGHALGDLVGIKKHFRRKHSDRRQWACERCGKGYAVQSDYKAHLKTCGTRGHTCDCGRVFSRVESFIEHQDTCVARGYSQPACLSRTGSSSSPSADTDSNTAAPAIASTWPSLISISTAAATTANPKLELQLLPASTTKPSTTTSTASPSAADEAATTRLQLSLASSGSRTGIVGQEGTQNQQLRAAAAEKALADEARRQAKRQLELAQQELANAMRTRQQAQAELSKAYTLRNNAAKSVNSMLLQVTCHECKKRLRAPGRNSLASSAVSDDERSRNSV